MTRPPDNVLADLAETLGRSISGEVRFDKRTRVLYSTDASIYQIEPFGVAFPRNGEELIACVEIASSYQVPILARGAGTSLAGQAIGPALILDCSRYLCNQIDINPEERCAEIDPGVILNALNRAAAGFGLQFGPDPASSERATIAGSLANNATGARSILYGMAADHLLAVDAVLSGGEQATFEQVTLLEAARRAGLENPNDVPELQERRNSITREGEVYRAALKIRRNYADAIRSRWPRTWRRASGYNLNYLIPWSPSRPPLWEEWENGRSGDPAWDSISIDPSSSPPYPPVPDGSLNLAPLLAGSEGTLAVIRRAKVRLVPSPRHTILGVLDFPELVSACEAVPGLLDEKPSAIELIPESLVQLARSVPAYAQLLGCLDPICRNGIPAAMLVIEFSGDDPVLLREKALNLRADVLLAESPEDQRQVWGIRKVGLGLLMSRPGEPKPVPFIEDLAVPVEKLGEFVREMERIFAHHGTRGDFYAHASAGCLHIRPLLNLKTGQGLVALREIAAEAIQLTLKLGGTPSGEHGDGLARSGWMEHAFGPEVMEAFHLLKNAADPQGLLNPGKILDPPDMDANLRYGLSYKAEAWMPVMDFSRQAGMVGAVEQCNGAGVCRKAEGVMCPSFQVTKDEMHSTRGRANLLRALFTGNLPPNAQSEQTVFEALSLCLACKGCKAECPSAVDMAKLKYEFVEHYYRPGAGRLRPLRDYLFGNIGLLGRLGYPVSTLVNLLFSQPVIPKIADRILGVSSRREYPRLSPSPLRVLAKRGSISDLSPNGECEEVLFLTDPFIEYFYPEVSAGLAAYMALRQAGCRVHFLPVVGSGRTLISKGFVKAAQRQAARVVSAINRLDPEGKSAIVGVEPSEIYALRDEYRELLPDDRRVDEIAERSYMIDEFLVRPGLSGEKRMLRIANNLDHQTKNRGEILLHGHCYQKAQPPSADGFPNGLAATVAMLEAVGYKVKVIEAGCCGMAGAFGYETEHYDVSMKIGEQALFPAIRNSEEGVLVAAAGISCQAQIKDGTGRRPLHPIELVLKTGMNQEG